VFSIGDLSIEQTGKGLSVTAHTRSWRPYRRAALALLLLAGFVVGEVAMNVLWNAPAFAGNNGNGNGNGNGSGSGGSGGGSAATTGDGAVPEIEDANSALDLREAGEIRSLNEVYKKAEQQLGGQVIDAKLVGSKRQGWNYDLRVVTQDGHVRKARYDAATLALRALDGQPVE